MTLLEYQVAAIDTAIYPNQNSFQGLVYCALKLNGEAGEVAEHIGKSIRDDASILTPDREELIACELGDVLWYLANMAEELGLTLNEIAQMNLQKLASRKARGALGGSGDNR